MVLRVANDAGIDRGEMLALMEEAEETKKQRHREVWLPILVPLKTWWPGRNRATETRIFAPRAA